MRLDRIIAVRTSKTVCRDGDDCIKLFGEAYSKADVLSEALNQARVEETGLKVPKIRAVTKLDGKWAIVSDYIKGKTLDRLIAEQPDKKAEYIDVFVDLQIKIHQKSCPHLKRLKDKMQTKIDQADIDGEIKKWLFSRLENLPERENVCHGDFNPSNVIVAEDGECFVLDWSHVTRGDAAADAARTYLSFRLDGKADDAENYIKLFCLKTATDEERVRSWLPIVAASQSVKGRAEEREFLLSLAAQVKG